MKTEPLGSAAQPALMDPATNECPFDWYARLRIEAPVHRDAASGIYVVTRYDLVIEALRDPQRFSNAVDQASLRPGGLPAAAKEILATGVRVVSTPASCDPPAHTRYRALVNRAFTASRVRGMAPKDDMLTDLVAARIEGERPLDDYELISGLSALLRRLRNVRFAPGANDFRHHPSFYLRGLKALYLVFDPA